MVEMSDIETDPVLSQSLDQAAGIWGIEREFWDIWGKHHKTPPETEARVLRSLGVDVSSGPHLQRAIEDRNWREWSEPLPPAIVLSDSEPYEIAIRVPADSQSLSAGLEIRFENGMTARADIDLARIPVSQSTTLRGRTFVEKVLPLPGQRCLGYHSMALRVGPHIQSETRLILCPSRAYQPEWLQTKCAAGIAISLYGLRSGRNWGCGDFKDLAGFVDWASRELAVSFVALNPLHNIPNRQPFNTSPYLPNCCYFRNPIYLNIEDIDDFPHSRWAQRLAKCDAIQRELESVRSSELVEYERVHHLKTRFLRLLFRRFLTAEFPHDTPRAGEFRAFIKREGDLLHRFAVHSALDEVLHRRDPQTWSWQAWPEAYRRPDSPATREFAERHWRRVLFYKYVQWQIDVQLGAAQRHARKRGMRIGLYHDLALATDRFGCDLWSHRDFYVAGCRVGSPPDNFAPKGQDWAFPPPNTDRHYRDGYQLFAESIRQSCQHGGALRIDHVMRLFRLFWIPDGTDAAHGTYVRERFHDLLHVLALESVRNRVVIIGEDLGTVPDFVRETLAKLGILSYRLFYFEQDKNRRFKRPKEYPRESLVSITTHDLPTLAGFWSHRDIVARREAGLIANEEDLRRAHEERLEEKQKMLDLFFELKLIPDSLPRDVHRIPELTGELHNAVVGFIASTPSVLMVLNQEDLFKQNEQQNLPGTTAEYPNWRRKMRFTIEELGANPFVRDCAAMYRAWVEKTGRANYMK